ncbi:hypothetical protein [Shewanella sedimentimangrovi]|uniref:DUF4829 domain-containing protein n=1 Tax=Shewanella sedimentimangrovi TaxID=2814293 RepID=A0ABX7R2C3_9GAMM|nr:hypothetical protein [Shewanella sedimentimangrovi]QSX37215.1 hypothetical protein JYB85_18555 [Shewanella sedimentimangrovi]
MKKIIILTIILSISFFVQSCANAKSAEEFAKHLQSVIASGDKTSFRKMLSLQRPGDEGHIAEQVDYVFNSKSSKIRTLLMNNNTKIFVSPFINVNGEPTKKFIIIYYNPNIIDFTKPVSIEQLEEQWLNGYVETSVEFINDGWFFVDAAFYQGSSPSWGEDY